MLSHPSFAEAHRSAMETGTTRPVDPTAIVRAFIPGVDRALNRGVGGATDRIAPASDATAYSPALWRRILRPAELITETPDRFRILLTAQDLLGGHNVTAEVAARVAAANTQTGLRILTGRQGGRTTLVAYAALGVAALMLGASLLMTWMRRRHGASW